MTRGGPARAIHLSRASQRRDRSRDEPSDQPEREREDQAADAQQDDRDGLQRVLAGQGPCFGEYRRGRAAPARRGFFRLGGLLHARDDRLRPGLGGRRGGARAHPARRGLPGLRPGLVRPARPGGLVRGGRLPLVLGPLSGDRPSADRLFYGRLSYGRLSVAWPPPGPRVAPAGAPWPRASPPGAARREPHPVAERPRPGPRPSARPARPAPGAATAWACAPGPGSRPSARGGRAAPRRGALAGFQSAGGAAAAPRRRAL